MAKRLLTADQVKEYLDIPDFRHLTRDKLIEFVSAIPDMDNEVAVKVIEQFPEFTGYAKVLVDHYETMCDDILKENGRSVQAVMDGYKQTLDLLGELARDEKSSPEDKRYFAEEMVKIADKMAAFDTSNKNFLAGITKYITWFACGTLVACAGVLGVRIKGTRIPRV